MAIPKPGKPVRGSTTGAPIMALFDLLGRRWAMGIIWNLAAGPVTFRALQALHGRRSGIISPSVLNARIKDLQEARLVERTLDGYALTGLGRELFDFLEPLDAYAQKWGKAL
ncbi:MAG TPA: helix-turn-helix domain-containing protein [Spirochaetia bacterium]|nr:helix-turn-helix domain-containing protein [Spirochaetia bacterium]